MDPHQDVGVFLWIGTKCEIDRREECARGAEGYMREKGFDHATPVSAFFTLCISNEFDTSIKMSKNLLVFQSIEISLIFEFQSLRQQTSIIL